MTEDIRKNILAVNNRLCTVSSILRRIEIAENREDSIHTKMAYESFRSYQEDISEGDKTVPGPDDPSDPENVAEHYRELRSELVDEKPELEAQRAELRGQMISLLEDLLETLSVDGESKKSQIIALKEALRSNLRGDMIAEVVDCSNGYPGKFKWDDEQGCVGLQGNAEARRENRFSDAQKGRVKQRDDYMCVKCGAESQLRVHHIIPIKAGGEGNISNGAALCKSCHDALHRWENGYSQDYESVSEFWSWVLKGDQ